MTKEKKPIFTLPGIGLIIIFGGALIKVWLQSINANGALIDLARLTFFVGILFIVLGVIRNRRNPDKKV